MSIRIPRALGALAVACALVAVGALPAAATTPGDGAVIFNPDGTPIGSELTYGGSSTPQFVYTAETQDDDFWGLDSGGEPANDNGNFNSVDTGIPLGFAINVNGVVYDEALVSSNGGVCLVSSTDPTANDSYNECTIFYDEVLATLVDPDYSSGPNNYAAFLPFNQDLESALADPVDTNADTIPDECTYGAFLFDFMGSFYCSTVFWGTTTYEGKPAFVATWYHDPDIDATDDSMFNTFQVLLVDDGGGNVTVVYNYDDVLNSGESLDQYGSPSSNLAEAACRDQFDDGDTADYLFGGVIGSNFATSAMSLALFGPACDDPVFDQTADSLINGGAFALIDNSLNSTVAGRYIFRMVNGQPDLTTLALAAPVLAATGADLSVPLFVALSGLLVGGGLLMYRRTRIRTTN